MKSENLLCFTLLLLATFTTTTTTTGTRTTPNESTEKLADREIELAGTKGWFSKVGDYSPVMLIPPTFVLTTTTTTTTPNATTGGLERRATEYKYSCQLEGLRINRARPRGTLWPVIKYVYWKFDIDGENRQKFDEYLTWFLAWPEPLQRLKQVVVDKIAALFHSHAGEAPGEEGIIKMSLNWTSPEALVEGATLTVGVYGEGDDRESDYQTALVATGPTGWLVFSDIDDTIKHTGILDSKETLWNTFIRPFSAVKGMSTLFHSLNAVLPQKPLFVYCSASPIIIWKQLFDFIRREQFPIGPMLMAQTTAYNFKRLMALKDLYAYKVEKARELRTKLPQKQWIMIGDSGQMDPAAYATIYLEMMNLTRPSSTWLSKPAIIKAGGERRPCIYIRAVSGVNAALELEKNDPIRFMEDFRGVPYEDWMVFNDPAELQGINPDLSCYPPGKTNPIPAKAKKLWEERGALKRAQEKEFSEWLRFSEIFFSVSPAK